MKLTTITGLELWGWDKGLPYELEHGHLLLERRDLQHFKGMFTILDILRGSRVQKKEHVDEGDFYLFVAIFTPCKTKKEK